MKYTKYLNDTNPRVRIDMGSFGVMELELFPEVAPITVENYLKLVDEKFYDGLIFHRVIKEVGQVFHAFVEGDGQFAAGIKVTE